MTRRKSKVYKPRRKSSINKTNSLTIANSTNNTRQNQTTLLNYFDGKENEPAQEESKTKTGSRIQTTLTQILNETNTGSRKRKVATKPSHSNSTHMDLDLPDDAENNNKTTKQQPKKRGRVSKKDAIDLFKDKTSAKDIVSATKPVKKRGRPFKTTTEPKKQTQTTRKANQNTDNTEELLDEPAEDIPKPRGRPSRTRKQTDDIPIHYQDETDIALLTQDRFAEMEDSGDEFRIEGPKRARRLKRTNPKKKQKTKKYAEERETNSVRDTSLPFDEPSNTAREESDQEDDTNSEQVEARDSLQKVNARLPFEKVTTVWPLISKFGIERINEIYERASISTRLSLKTELDKSRALKKSKRPAARNKIGFMHPEDEKVMRDFHELVLMFFDKVDERLDLLPVPPSTRKSHYIEDILKSQNERLESVLVPLTQQTNDLKNEIEKEKAAVKETEEYLKMLQSSSREQLKEQERLLKKKSPYIKMTPDLSQMSAQGDSMEELHMVESDYDDVPTGDYEEFKENAILIDEDSEFEDDKFDDELGNLATRNSLSSLLNSKGNLDEQEIANLDDPELSELLGRLHSCLDVMGENLTPMIPLLTAVDQCTPLLRLLECKTSFRNDS